MTALLGIFLVPHGLVHIFYAGQSWRIFELRTGMVWPDDSWLFSKLLGEDATRFLASSLLLLVTLGFMAGGLGLIIRQDWWQPVTMGAAVLSSVIFILFWDGKLKALDAQGGIGLLINLAILTIVLILR